jgi:xanthine dehydrogenase accessory factor
VRDEIYRSLKRELDAERLVALATVIRGAGAGRQRLLWPDGRAQGTLGASRLDAAATDAARELFPRSATTRLEVAVAGERFELFVEAFPPRPTLVVVGAGHVAIPLVRMARVLGFRTVVVDPRSAFATRDRFAEADELIVDWPERALGRERLHESSYVAVLSHDFKIDVPALKLALRSPAPYVGVLGSRRTRSRRAELLAAEGVTEREIARLHSPIGLPLGGRRAEEIALAILAEVVSAVHGRQASPGRHPGDGAAG